MYKVSVAGEKIGYIKNEESLEEDLKSKIKNETDKNIESIEINLKPEYEFQLLSKSAESNENEVINIMIDNTIITYKYYNIIIGENTIESVNTIDEAAELVEIIKQESKLNPDLAIIENYTQNEEEVNTKAIELARVDIGNRVDAVIAEQEAIEAEEARIAAMPDVNGVKLSHVPLTGTITSRFGELSSIRSSIHTGLDIAAPKGTSIQSMAAGIVTYAAYNGSYGNLVKIDHGDGIESWYAHCDKLYVNVGQSIEAGAIIATVGSTGNSTGNHLHLEIRIDGQYVDPQQYLYNQ